MPNYEEIIRQHVEQSKITYLSTSGGGQYPYAILPLDSRLPQDFRNAVTEGLWSMLKDELRKANVLMLIEAKGFLLTPFADRAKLPIVVVRKRNYNYSDQIVIEQRTAYRSEITKMYCIGLEHGDKILIVDDMISSGETEMGVIRALDGNGFEIVGVASVFERGEGVKNIEKETGRIAKGLARLEIVDGKPKITGFYRPWKRLF